jgi:glyoxylase-like metal-dependent hydrolase (beta-lactamase superfamily II)
MLYKDQINDHLIRYSSRAAYVNSSFIETDSGLIIIDTMLLPRDGKELEKIKKEYNKKVKFIINSHWHSDHCYGNRFLVDSDTEIIAHKDFLETLKLEKNVINPSRQSIVNHKNLRFPTKTICENYEFMLENEDFSLIHHPGHSNDSISIFWKNRKIIFTGDTVLNSNDNHYAVPYFFWGNSSDLICSLENIVEVDPELIVTGHGKPVKIDKIEQDITYLSNLIKFSKQLYKATYSYEEFVDVLMKEVKPEIMLNGISRSDFWVPDMHNLNLKKMAKEIIESNC